MNANQLVNHLIESHDSMEGVPDYDAWFLKAIRDAGSPEGKQYRLKNHPPTNSREARHMGVNWFIKNGRKFTFSDPEVHPPSMYQNSKTMATNRNQRRKSFGYRDTYSMRERGWATAYRKPDGSMRPERTPEERPQKYEI